MFIKNLKFSLWADFIERDFIDGEFRSLIDKGIVNGATSNPAIFKNAILTSAAYKEQLAGLQHLTPKEKYEAVAIYDIQKAADALRSLYDVGDDGYVSIEVDPHLCDDAQASIDEGRRLYKTINRPNVMIKIPATAAGYVAMEALVREGICVNATLIFSKEQALSAVRAIRRGLDGGGKRIATVISVFVSRIDRALDDELSSKGVEPSLAGIYNASAIYEAVAAEAVEGCRTLFASTGVKGDRLRPSYYVDELLAHNSVNTAPIDTIHAFVTEKACSEKLPIPAEKVSALFAAIKGAGVDYDGVIAKQIRDGLGAFKDAFDEILDELK